MWLETSFDSGTPSNASELVRLETFVSVRSGFIKGYDPGGDCKAGRGQPKRSVAWNRTLVNINNIPATV